VLLLAKKYPHLKIVNFDRLDCKFVQQIILAIRSLIAAIMTIYFSYVFSPDCSCLENLDEIKDLPNYKFVKGNICSSELVSYVLETEKIDTIMHFAAQTHVDNSFGNSFQFTQNNILGTHVLLESAKVANIKRFIHVSTDEVYGEQRIDQEAMNEEQVSRLSIFPMSIA
jgi:dTDP-D-glucose 4,6-dehydratase